MCNACWKSGSNFTEWEMFIDEDGIENDIKLIKNELRLGRDVDFQNMSSNKHILKSSHMKYFEG